MTDVAMLTHARRRWRATLSVVLLSAPSLIVYSVAHLGLWPAQMTPDSVSQWLSSTGVRPPRDVHSGLHVGIIYVLTRLWLSPAIVVIAQYVAISFVTGLVLLELRRWLVPMWIVVLVSVALPLWPANIFLVTTIWTDVFYAFALLLCLRFLLIAVRTHGESFIRPGFVFGFVAALIVLALSRQNGLISATLIAASAAIYMMRAAPVRAAALFLIVLTAPLAIKTAYPALGILRPNMFITGAVPVHYIGAYLVARHPINSEDQALLNAVSPIDTWMSRYSCENENVFFAETTLRDAVGENLGALFRLAFRLMVEDPKIYLTTLACSTELLWKPVTFRLPIPVIGLPPLGIDQLGPLWAGQPPIRFTPLSTAVHDALVAIFSFTADFDRRWLFWRPAWPLYLTIAVSMLLAVERRRWDMMLICIPSVATTLSFVPFIVGPAYRYQWGVVLVGLLTWPLLFAAKRDKN